MPVSKKSVGATGRRRIVPMNGIDFIAGNIESKTVPLERYGGRLGSLGGRTRRWSNINFLQVNPKGRKPGLSTTKQITWRADFSNAVKSARNTLQNLAVLTQIQQEYISGVIRQEVNPMEYATIQGWVSAVRIAQVKAGTEITPSYIDWFAA